MKTMVSHPGQEHCYVLSGEILFHVGDTSHRLRAGEGIFIDSEQPHRAESVGKTEAHVLMIVSKPSESAVATDWWKLPKEQKRDQAIGNKSLKKGETL